jgi:hypothetical protein
MKKREATGQPTEGAVPRRGAGRHAGQPTEQATQAAQAAGWCDIDPGFCLATPDAEAIDPRFAARCGDPAQIDPGFLIPPPDRPIR